MKHLMSVLFGIMAASFLFLSSCATTELTGVWKDERFSGRINKVVVMGIFEQAVTRNLFEDEFVRQLKARGVNAVASYTVVPIDELPDNDIVKEKIGKLGVDSVIVTRLVDKKTIQTYVPGQAYAVPGYYGFWGPYRRYPYSPGYIVEDEFAFAETSVYESEGERLVWSARSQTLISGTSQDLMRSFVGIMVGRLISDNMIR
jgi:hypothetical protein